MEMKVEVRGISPILQRLLIAGMESVRHPLNEQDYWSAWHCLKNLILHAPPSVQATVVHADNSDCQFTLMQWIRVVDTALEQIAALPMTVNREIAQNQRKYQIYRYLEHRVPFLFNATANALFEGGYLQRVSERLAGKEIEV